MSERDVRALNMDTASAKAALGTGDIDAAFGGSDYLALRDQGQYNWNIQEAKRFGLIRKTFRFEDWYAPQFLDRRSRSSA